MKFKHTFYFFFFLFFFSFLNLFAANSIHVKNVHFRQQDAKIYINYQLEGDWSKAYSVNVKLSDNGGATFDITPKTMTGDIGKAVSPGSQKQIVWDFMKDYPNGLDGTDFVFSVQAELKKSGSKWPWYFLGAGAVGGAVWYFTQPEDEKGSINVSIPGEF